MSASWPDHRFLDLVKVEHPIVAAPMAGAAGVGLAVAAIQGGGLGSLPCACCRRIRCAPRSPRSGRGRRADQPQLLLPPNARDCGRQRVAGIAPALL